MFPLLSETNNVIFYGCDFSPRAIQFVKVSNPKSLNYFSPFTEVTLCPVMSWYVMFRVMEKCVGFIILLLL